jgi:hypothetical protein
MPVSEKPAYLRIGGICHEKSEHHAPLHNHRKSDRRLGVLIGISGPDGQARANALVQGLGALNWHEGSNLRIDWRWAGGDTTLYERYADGGI